MKLNAYPKFQSSCFQIKKMWFKKIILRSAGISQCIWQRHFYGFFILKQEWTVDIVCIRTLALIKAHYVSSRGTSTSRQYFLVWEKPEIYIRREKGKTIKNNVFYDFLKPFMKRNNFVFNSDITLLIIRVSRDHWY